MEEERRDEASELDTALLNARSHLAQALAQTEHPQRARPLILAMKEADGFEAVMAASPLKEKPLKGLARLIGLAEDGRYEEALAYTGIAVPNRPAPPIARLVHVLEELAVRPAGPLRDASGRRVVFVVSYPRSGSTRFLNFMAAAFPASRYTAFLPEGQYFSTRGGGSAAAGPVFVKDHRLREDYAENPVLYLVRDGRDVMLSLNDFTLRKPGLSAEAVAEGAAGLDGVLGEGERASRYGAWPEHVAEALDWKDAGRPVTILRYDALMGENGFEASRDALAETGIDYTRKGYDRGVNIAANREALLRQNNPSWQRTRIYPEGSLMDCWLDTPEASKWQTLLRPADKAVLHEAGFTGTLLRAGFEDDADWWRS